MPNDKPLVVWVFGAMATGAVAVASYLWTEVVRLDRRIDGITQTAQVQVAQISECQNLEATMAQVSGVPFEYGAAHDLFVERGCVKTKVQQ